MKRMVLFLLGATILGAPGCSGDGAPPDAAMPTREPESRAKTLPIPGAGDATARAAPADPARLTWSVPAGWVEEAPASSMRLAQYRVSGSGGDASCLVFYFGPGQGGDLAGNARRWASQFSQPDGRASTEVMMVTQFDLTKLPAQLVELTGTYEGGMSAADEPVSPQTGYMLLGAMVQGPDAPWFFKFTGPETTLREQRQAFVDLIASVRADG